MDREILGIEGKVANLELFLLDNGNFERYHEYMAKARERGCHDSFNNLRHMLALAHAFNEHGGKDQYMFIGGIGVLGNCLRHTNEEDIFDYRGVHDIDVVLRSRPYEYVVTDLFDKINVRGCSLSIHGKLIISGYCVDTDCEPLSLTDIDAYIPHGHPKFGAVVNGVHFDYLQWESRKTSTLLGISFNVVNPLTLLCLKLNINPGKKSNRREKDCMDIVNLLGVLESDDCSPEEIYDGLEKPQYDKLKEIYSENCGKCENCGLKSCVSLTPPNLDYVKSIFALEEADEECL